MGSQIVRGHCWRLFIRIEFWNEICQALRSASSWYHGRLARQFGQAGERHVQRLASLNKETK